MEKYFSTYSDEFRQMVIDESTNYERNMPIPPMPGSIEFMRMLKTHGVKIGLVTSSDSSKIDRAFKMIDLDGIFDTIVTADRITEGKPNPMCYLLAANDLSVSPEQCIVFEDSFNGIKAGNDAGMRVIGLSTTNPEESLRELVFDVVPNLQECTFEDWLRWQS